MEISARTKCLHRFVDLGQYFAWHNKRSVLAFHRLFAMFERNKGLLRTSKRDLHIHQIVLCDNFLSQKILFDFLDVKTAIVIRGKVGKINGVPWIQSIDGLECFAFIVSGALKVIGVECACNENGKNYFTSFVYEEIF